MSIQRKLWISNLILIFITILLLIGVSLIITENFREFIEFSPPDSQRQPIFFNRTFLRADRTIMKIIETEPDKLLNSDYINQLDILLNSLNAALIIEKDRDVIHFSPFLSEIGIDYHNILQKQVETTNRTDGIIRISDTLFVKTIPVDYSDNTTGTLFLINDSTIAAEELKTFKNSVIYTLILFLIIMIIINTLITYLLSRQIVSPIVRLKNAAQLIQKGNYDF